MKIYALTVGELSENCYIVATEKNNAFVVDPGAEADEILYSLTSKNLTLKKIILTHGHFDHIMAVNKLVKETNAEVYIHEADKDCLTDVKHNLLNGFMVGAKFESIEKATLLKDDNTVSLDEITFRVMHTPGHSKGSVCYICEEHNVMFTGDTIFKGSVGNTTFPYASHSEMMNSIDKISKLTKDYKMYPGHGPCTSLTEEKNHNIYFCGINQI